MVYDSLLLDHDGVIVTLGDTAALVEAAHASLRDAGIENPPDDAVDTLSLAVADDELHALGDRYSLDPDHLFRLRDDRMEEAIRAETTAGRKRPYDDVDVLGDVSVPTGIVSNNQTRIVEFVMEHYELDHHFGAIHARSPTRESLARKKPAPTFLEEAMNDLSISNPLYVGDSESDVIAGQRAGLDVAFLRRDHNADDGLAVTPDYEVHGLDEVVGLVEGKRQEV
jgi:HAD superfamily hydrolase (TIGR01549 family)